MLTLWNDANGVRLFGNYLAGRGSPVRQLFQLRQYQWDSPVQQVAAGPQIFGAIDRLSPLEREAASSLFRQLGALQPGVPLLNDPARCLLRGELLTRLAELGLNRFRVYRGSEASQVVRFPVFVRCEADHGGNLTPLLQSPAALRKALTALRLRGRRLRELLIVEYCDTSDTRGEFRKFGAFRVGAAIVPAHLMISRAWMTKADSNQRTMAQATEERAYVEANPHAEWLRRVFDLAGIDFGRIDYSVIEGAPQAWEINFSPTIGRALDRKDRPTGPPEVEAYRTETRLFYHRRLADAFRSLDAGSCSGTLRLELDATLLETIRRQASVEGFRRRAWSVVAKLYQHPRAGLLRAGVRRFFPSGPR